MTNMKNIVKIFHSKKNLVEEEMNIIRLAAFCNPLKLNENLINSDKQNLALIDIGYDADDSKSYLNESQINRKTIEQNSEKINNLIRNCLYKDKKSDIISKFNNLISHSIKDEILWFYIVNNNETYDSEESRKNRSLVPLGFNFGLNYIHNINKGDFECYVRVNPVFKNKYNANKMHFYVFLEFKNWTLKSVNTDILIKK